MCVGVMDAGRVCKGGLLLGGAESRGSCFTRLPALSNTVKCSKEHIDRLSLASVYASLRMGPMLDTEVRRSILSPHINTDRATWAAHVRGDLFSPSLSMPPSRISTSAYNTLTGHKLGHWTNIGQCCKTTLDVSTL